MLHACITWGGYASAPHTSSFLIEACGELQKNGGQGTTLCQFGVTAQRLRRVVYGLELDDLETPGHCGKPEHDGLAHAPSDQRFSDRRRHADVPLLEFHGIAEDETVALPLAGLLVL